jgi:hypothetical protein
VSAPSGEESETTPFVEEQPSRAAFPLLVQAGCLALATADARFLHAVALVSVGPR